MVEGGATSGHHSGLSRGQIRLSFPQAHSPQEAAHALAWTSPAQPGDWTPVTRRFRDGHTQTWWAAEAALPAAGWGPDQPIRLVVATTDPATLPKLTTWYLVTNLPRPASRARSTFPPADLAELVRLYGLRNWVEQGYKQVKHELGWADFQVRSDRAIRRHWQLVACAFTFCWQAFLVDHPADPTPADPTPADPVSVAPAGAARGETTPSPHRSNRSDRLLADRAALGAGLADPVQYAAALLAGVVASAPTAATATAA